jgi:hypothetical protein
MPEVAKILRDNGDYSLLRRKRRAYPATIPTRIIKISTKVTMGNSSLLSPDY